MTNLTLTIILFQLELILGGLCFIYARERKKKSLRRGNGRSGQSAGAAGLMGIARRMTETHAKLLNSSAGLRSLAEEPDPRTKEFAENSTKSCEGVMGSLQTTARAMMADPPETTSVYQAVAVCGEAIAMLIDESMKSMSQKPPGQDLEINPADPIPNDVAPPVDPAPALTDAESPSVEAPAGEPKDPLVE